MLAAQRKLYDAAAAGNSQAFEAARQEVIRLVLISNIQATLKYAELVDKSRAAGDIKTMEDDQVGVVGTRFCNASKYSAE